MERAFRIEAPPASSGCKRICASTCERASRPITCGATPHRTPTQKGRKSKHLPASRQPESADPTDDAPFRNFVRWETQFLQMNLASVYARTGADVGLTFGLKDQSVRVFCGLGPDSSLFFPTVPFDAVGLGDRERNRPGHCTGTVKSTSSLTTWGISYLIEGDP